MSVQCPTSSLDGQGFCLCLDPTLDLPGLGDPTFAYSAFSIPYEIIRSCKPHYHSKAEIPSGGLILARCNEILAHSNFCECWRNIMDTLCSKLCIYTCILSTVNQILIPMWKMCLAKVLESNIFFAQYTFAVNVSFCDN